MNGSIFLYSDKEKNCVCFTVYMVDTMYFEQFYCFPLKNGFLGEARRTPHPSCPVSSPSVQLRCMTHTASPLRLTSGVGIQFSPRLPRGQGDIRPWLSLEGAEVEKRQSLLLVDCGTGGQVGCAQARSQGGEKDVQKEKQCSPYCQEG